MKSHTDGQSSFTIGSYTPIKNGNHGTREYNGATSPGHMDWKRAN